MLKKTQKLLIYSRILIIAALLALQIGWIVLSFTRLYALGGVASVVSLLAALFALTVIGRDDNPELKIGWLIVILAFPFFGVPLYLFFGSSRPTRKMRRKLDSARERMQPYLKQEPAVMAQLAAKDVRTASGSGYIAHKGGYPLFCDTQAVYYPSGESYFEAMTEAIRSAKKFIFLEFFIIEPGKMWNTILDALLERAQNGVQVRILYDDFGSVLKVPNYYEKTLNDLHENIRAHAFNPVKPLIAMVMNNRDHRKILAVDGNIAFNGGVNLADEYINEIDLHGHWKDTGVKITGRGAWGLTAMFLEMWNAFYEKDADFTPYMPTEYAPAQGFVQPYGDSPFDNEYLGENVYIDILARAQSYVYITTPYLILDNTLRTALCAAAKRGVDVRIITPGTPDKRTVFRLTRSNYRPLSHAGVKIYEYTPGFIHAKSMVSDDYTGVVGSINLDYRSLYLHFECSTCLYGMEAVLDLKRDIEETIEKSAPVSWEEIRPGFWGGLFDAALHMLETLF